MLFAALPALSCPGQAPEGMPHLLFSGEKSWTIESRYSERYREAWGDFWSPASWSDPDYFNGNLYLRFEVLSKPTNEEMSIQLCLWFGDYYADGICELCLYQSDMPWFTFQRAGEVLYLKFPPFSAWTHHQGRPWDGGERFHKIMFQMRARGKEVKLISEDATLAEKRKHLGEATRELLPVKWRAEGYVVPKGGVFAPPEHWVDVPEGWLQAEGDAPFRLVRVLAK